MKGILWLDVETTGLLDYRHGIIQMAGMVEVDGSIAEEFNIYVKPFPQDQIDDVALKVNGVSRAQLLGFQEPLDAHNELMQKITKYGKLMLAGYNVNFDKGFFNKFLQKVGYVKFGSILDYHVLDVMTAALIYCHAKHIRLPNIKLATVADHFGFSTDFHQAHNDIKVTRDIYYRILENFNGVVQ